MKPIGPKQFQMMRKRMGYPQTKIALWFGTSPQNVGRWERGESAIPGPAKVLMWLLYDQEINGNKHAVRDYARSVIGRDLRPHASAIGTT